MNQLSADLGMVGQYDEAETLARAVFQRGGRPLSFPGTGPVLVAITLYST